jgi:hypothetical protein
MEAAEGMAALLRKLAGQIFAVPLQSFKMFVAHSGNRIAFNLQRAVYFNLGIYADLHHGYHRIRLIAHATAHAPPHTRHRTHHHTRGTPTDVRCVSVG